MRSVTTTFIYIAEKVHYQVQSVWGHRTKQLRAVSFTAANTGGRCTTFFLRKR